MLVARSESGFLYCAPAPQKQRLPLYPVRNDAGRWKGAEKLLVKAVEENMRALGAEHPKTLSSVANLGDFYSQQGKLAEAEAIYLRALAGYEKALGAEHTSTLSTVHDLGVLYETQGKLVEAEAMYLRALAGYKKVQGAEALSIIIVVFNLLDLYTQQNKLAEAEAMYARELAGYEKALDPHQSKTRAVSARLQQLLAPSAPRKPGRVKALAERFRAGLKRSKD